MLKKMFIVSLSLLTINYTLHAAEPQFPLHEAVRIGDSSKVKELLKHRDVNEKDCGGWTPFYYAVAYGHLEVVQVLLADSRCTATTVNEKANGAWTPLHCAAANGHYKVVQLLLADRRCTTVNEKDNSGAVSLDVARLRGNYNIEYLITHWSAFVTGLHISWCKSILAGTHPRCGATSSLQIVPNHEIRQILSYVHQGTCIYSHEDIVRYVAIAQLQQQGAGWCTIS